MNEEITRIYQAINAVSMRVNDVNSRLDSYINNRVDEITPYTATQTAYIDDTEIVFEEVKEGNLSVYVKDSEGNYPDYTVERAGDRVTVRFEPLENETTVTISII